MKIKNMIALFLLALLITVVTPFASQANPRHRHFWIEGQTFSIPMFPSKRKITTPESRLSRCYWFEPDHNLPYNTSLTHMYHLRFEAPNSSGTCSEG